MSHSELKAKFELIREYLVEHPENFPGKSKKLKSSFEKVGFESIKDALFKKFSESRKIKKLSLPQTIPDEVVSLILKEYYKKPEKELAKIQTEHQESMSAENIVGDLLERYLASVLEPLGWVWCSGETIKAIDFIKKTETEWIELQVKNRDNTENSSSSKVREGTEIKKWFRCFSKKAKFNWDKFPTEEKKYLSEEKFRAFVIEYLKNLK